MHSHSVLAGSVSSIASFFGFGDLHSIGLGVGVYLASRLFGYAIDRLFKKQ